MNNELNQELLEELRKVTAYIDAQKKTTKKTMRGLYIFLGILLFAMLTAIYLSHKISEERRNSRPISWADVDRDEDSGQFESALAKALQLVGRSPNAYFAYKRLAFSFLYVDDLEKAYVSAKRAHELLPTEANLKLIKAIESIMNAQSHNSSEVEDGVGQKNRMVAEESKQPPNK